MIFICKRSGDIAAQGSSQELSEPSPALLWLLPAVTQELLSAQLAFHAPAPFTQRDTWAHGEPWLRFAEAARDLGSRGEEMLVLQGGLGPASGTCRSSCQDRVYKPILGF